MDGFIAGALAILVLLALCALIIFLTMGLLTKNAFRRQKDWIRSTYPWRVARANKGLLQSFFSIVMLAVVGLYLLFVAIDFVSTHQDTFISVGLVGLYAAWKIGKWVLIFGVAYYVIKSIADGIIEAVSDRVAEKMRDRD